MSGESELCQEEGGGGSLCLRPQSAGGRRLKAAVDCSLEVGGVPRARVVPVQSKQSTSAGTVECLRTFSESLLCSSRGTLGSPVRYLLLSFLTAERSPSCQTPASTREQGRLPPVRALRLPLPASPGLPGPTQQAREVSLISLSSNSGHCGRIAFHGKGN